MIRVFKFTRDVQHKPVAQFSSHKQGSVLLVTGKAYEYARVSRDGKHLTTTVGHGLSDDFVIGEEVEELTGEEANAIIRAEVVTRMTPEERDAFNAHTT